MPERLDAVTIGRCSVDLYGQQIGGRFEDVASFAKSVGGSPANMAIGMARLGLKPALLTRVGDEQMGRAVRELLVREGVDVSGVKTDPDRLTALVLLAVEGEGVSPHIFYRTDCADMALDESDVDEALIGRSASIVVTGTHFSKSNTEAAQRKAIRLAKANGAKIAFDIDYRPNLWGLAGHSAGFDRYVKSDRVSARLRSVLPECDLVVGTEEEVMIAGGADGVLEALKAIRAVSDATIVLKRGARGCIVYAGQISDELEDGIVGGGFPVEIYNVLGAGDAFMAGFMRGWLRGEGWATCATWANACGAFAVSRLLCSPEYPTRPELAHFLEHGSRHHALRQDADLNHIHWATTRRKMPESLAVFAVDHRAQLEAEADAAGVPRTRIADFKLLAVEAAVQVAQGRPGFGLLLDSTYGRQALFRAAREPFWIGRPVEKPGSRPLEFDGFVDLGSHISEWPIGHTVKCLCFYHPDDPPDLKAAQERELLRVADAARTLGRELMIEIIAGRHGPLGRRTVATVLERFTGLGIEPDWWKLEPQRDAASWHHIEEVIAREDPYCRGVLLLGLAASEAELVSAFRTAARSSVVRGFAVGRTIFGDAARRWFAGEMSGADAVTDMAKRFEALAAAWQESRGELQVEELVR